MKYLWLANGLSGELGSQLLPLFEKSPKVKIEALDLNKNYHNPQVLLHMAARRPVHGTWQLIESNILYLKRVIAFAEKQKIPTFIFISTASLYNNLKKNLATEDDVCIQWKDVYAWTKYFGEKLVANSHIPMRLVLRLPAILERRSTTNFISKARHSIQNNIPLSCSHLDQPFNRLISAQEIHRFLESLTHQAGFHVVNMAPDPTFTLKQTLEAIAQRVAKPLPPIEVAPATSPALVIDNTRSKTLFNFHPRPISEQLSQWICPS